RTEAGGLGMVDARGVPPLCPGEMRSALAPLGLAARPPAVLRASFGWPRYARVLGERLAGGDDLETAWAEEMAPGGRLESAARHTYETLLLPSRGYRMSQAGPGAAAGHAGGDVAAADTRSGP